MDNFFGLIVVIIGIVVAVRAKDKKIQNQQSGQKTKRPAFLDIFETMGELKHAGGHPYMQVVGRPPQAGEDAFGQQRMAAHQGARPAAVPRTSSITQMESSFGSAAPSVMPTGLSLTPTTSLTPGLWEDEHMVSRLKHMDMDQNHYDEALVHDGGGLDLHFAQEDMVRSIVMAEILKRPQERRRRVYR